MQQHASLKALVKRYKECLARAYKLTEAASRRKETIFICSANNYEAITKVLYQGYLFTYLADKLT
jgi:hypothetical protein